jgi:hypothetical protein
LYNTKRNVQNPPTPIGFRFTAFVFPALISVGAMQGIAPSVCRKAAKRKTYGPKHDTTAKPTKLFFVDPFYFFA